MQVHAGVGPRMHRRRYGRPGPRTDVPSPDEIGMRPMAARATLEFTLALAVGLLAVSALGTGPAGVPGVHTDHGHAGKLGLVFEERTQLEESPTVE